MFKVNNKDVVLGSLLLPENIFHTLFQCFFVNLEHVITGWVLRNTCFNGACLLKTMWSIYEKQIKERRIAMMIKVSRIPNKSVKTVDVPNTIQFSLTTEFKSPITRILSQFFKNTSRPLFRRSRWLPVLRLCELYEELSSHFFFRMLTSIKNDSRFSFKTRILGILLQPYLKKTSPFVHFR